MELVIGRDTASSRLLITIDDKKKAMYGEPNSVPNSVSRKHCKITITNGVYKIQNLSPNNITYVNGNEVEQKKIKPESDAITLGAEHYALKIGTIINAIEGKPADNANANAKAVKPTEKNKAQQPLSITHLEEIWTKNHDDKLNFQIKERKRNAIRSATGLITSVSIVCAAIEDLKDFRTPLIIIGIVVGIYFAVVTYKASSESVLFMDKLDKDFRKKYVCPNPECHSFLSNNLTYEDLAKRGACPYCKTKFITK